MTKRATAAFQGPVELARGNSVRVGISIGIAECALVAPAEGTLRDPAVRCACAPA